WFIRTAQLGINRVDAGADGALGGGLPVAFSQRGLRRRCGTLFYHLNRHAVHVAGVGSVLRGQHSRRRYLLFFSGLSVADLSYFGGTVVCISGGGRTHKTKSRVARHSDSDPGAGYFGPREYASADRWYHARLSCARLASPARRRSTADAVWQRQGHGPCE